MFLSWIFVPLFLRGRKGRGTCRGFIGRRLPEGEGFVFVRMVAISMEEFVGLGMVW